MFLIVLVIIALVSSISVSSSSEKPFINVAESDVEAHRVMFSIDTLEEEPDKSHDIPQDIIIVLDISGSMSGDKIENSKRAILSIIDKMRSVDYISLVTFGSVATTVFDSFELNDKEIMENIVKSISVDGMTNMFDSLLHVEEILKKIRSRESPTKRIYLFSDGEVNQGETRESVICEKIRDFKELFSVVTSSFGVGDYYNERLMENIAEFGNGNYFFIRSGSDIVNVVDIAYSAFKNVIGTDAKIYFHMKNGVKLKKVYGYKQNEVTGILDLGDLRAADKRKFLIEVHIPKRSIDIDVVEESQIPSPSDNKLLILEYELKYLDLEKNEKFYRGVVYVELTKEDELLEKEDRNVKQFRKLQDLVEHEERVEKLLKEEDFEGAKSELEELDEMERLTLEEEEEDMDDEMVESYETVRRRRRKVKGMLADGGGESARRYSNQKKKMNFAMSGHLNAL